MKIVVLDAETYYDNDFTLSKLTTEAHCRDVRFEEHGWGIKLEGQAPFWLDRVQFAEWVKTIDWSNTAVVCHHAHFDLLIMSHVHDVKPAFIYCTLSMARLLIGNHLSASLASLAEHFNLGAKNIPYDLFKGKHWHEIAPDVQRQIAEGCCNDVQLTWDLFCKLAASFPQEEYPLVDATVRMFTEPCLVGNTNLLGEIWQREAENKRLLLAEMGLAGGDLRSNEKFAELLRAEGVEPETKPGKNGPIYAFAQTDDFMRDLLDDEDDRVATLAEARLSEKSNGVQTRTERLGYMSTRGAMCVYLNYAGTHLGGWSGGDKVNWQNFKRNGPIAKAIEAPPGHMIVLADASQIECRLLNMVAGQHDVIERFRNREDPYVTLATTFYGETIYKPKRDDPRYDEMEAKRGTGKQGELSCGYMAGALTAQRTAKKGTYGPPVYMTLEEAERLVNTFRSTHPAICAPNSGYWAQCGRLISRLAGGAPIDFGPFHIADGRVWLPNGTALIYDTLEHHTAEDGDKFWRVRTRKNGWTKIYSGKFTENLIQALRNVHIKRVWLNCRAAGINVVSNEHDKLIAVVREHEAQDAFDYMKAEMCRAPDWLPGIPLDSEGYISNTFGKPE